MIVGVLTGIVVSLFRWVLGEAESLRSQYIEKAEGSLTYLLIGVVALGVMAVIIAFLLKKEPLISGSGIPQVKGEMLGKIDSCWYKVLAAKFAGAVLAIGGGMSLGREGPSIQLGAMVGKGFSRFSRRDRTEEKLLMTFGAGGGLAAAFGAPLAGVVFSLEEVHKNFSTEVLVGTMASTITANWIASYIFGLKPVFDLTMDEALPLSKYWMILALGIVIGAIGAGYNKFTDILQNFFGKLKMQWLRGLLPVVAIVLFAVFLPTALGGGHHLVGFAAGGEAAKVLALLLLVKFFFSTFCFSTGAPGGIFLPLLVLGALTGGTFTGIFSPMLGFEDTYSTTFVVLGMAGMFSAIVRAPITGIILISEMTGTLSNLLSLSIVSFAAYVCAEALGGKPIYDQLLGRLLRGDSKGKEKKSQKVLVESQVYIGSPADGKQLCRVSLPKGCLIVSIEREGKEIIPSGSTVLKGGDKIVLLAGEDLVHDLEKELSRTFNKIEL